MDIVTSILSLLETLPTRVAEAFIDVQAFGASIEPEIVCTPFLNESRNVTEDTFSVSDKGIESTSTSRVCGTESAKTTKITNAIIPAEIQRRVRFINQ